MKEALQVQRDWDNASGRSAQSGYSIAGGGAVRWFWRISLRVLHEHLRERAREPIPESATDSSGYFLAKAISYDLDGEAVQARGYYDSARVAYEARIGGSTEGSTHPHTSGLATQVWAERRKRYAKRPIWDPLRDHPRFQALLARNE